MAFVKRYLVGINSVPVSVRAEWLTHEGLVWSFEVNIIVEGDGRRDDSIRHSDISHKDVREAFQFLDAPTWPNNASPDILIGPIDIVQARDIAAELSSYATGAYPTTIPSDIFFGV